MSRRYVRSESTTSVASSEDLDFAKEQLKNNNLDEDDIADKLSNFSSDTDDPDWPLEQVISEGAKVFEVFTNNQYREGYKILDKHASHSFIHAMGKALALAIGAVMTLRQDKFEESKVAAAYATHKINKKRKQRSTMSSVTTSLSSVMFKPNYSDYTDENCHAELCFAEIQAVNTICAILGDQTIAAFVRAAIKIRSCHRTYKECQRILKYKKNWQSEEMKRHFESGVYLGLGLFEVAISFFPSKLIRLLEVAGFSGDRVDGVDFLLKCADLQEAIRYPAVAVALSGFFGFAEYFYGIGEPNVDCIYRVLEHFSVRTPNSVAVTFGNAFREQYRGNFKDACMYYTAFTAGQTAMKPFHYMADWQRMWIYAAAWDWPNALEQAKDLVDNCRWSPSMFMYLYGVHLAMVADEEECETKKAMLMTEVIDCFEKVQSLKRNFGGKRAFHEKLVAENAKKFLDHPDKIVLPSLDLMYIWNVYQVASGSSDCLPRILQKIDQKIKLYPKNGDDLEIYCYLTFMRGCCFVHSKCPMLAMECFLEVLDNDKQLITQRHLAPQACFEIGQIYRRMSDYDQAKAWFKKVRRYSNYITDVMINFRIDYAMSSMK